MDKNSTQTPGTQEKHSSTTESKSKKKRRSKKKPTASKSVDITSPLSIEEQSGKILEESDLSDHEADETDLKPIVSTADTSVEDGTTGELANGASSTSTSTDTEDPTARFDAMVRDRDALREEVSRLRQSIEELQAKHTTEIEEVQGQLQETQNEKENAEENYQNLLGKVNTIRSQLGERLKADADELTQARTRIEELEEQRSSLQEQYTVRSSEVEEMHTKNRDLQRDLDDLRSRTTLSRQNWEAEKEELEEQGSYLRDEFDNAKQAMHDWELLAMEERSIRRDLAEKLVDVEEQLTSLRSEHERVVQDRSVQASTVESLQRAMQDVQSERKKELRELVEHSHKEIEELKTELEETRSRLKECQERLELAQTEVQRMLPFEKEVREKNLQLGQQRHQNIMLSEHLTKALRILKKGRPEETVDRQIVTSYFLQFLALDRADSKRFQILQLIAALLNWTDEQKEQAGLQRAGHNPNTTGSLRLPGTPMMHKTPSSPALSNLASFESVDSVLSPGGRDTLAELWQNFLEQETNASQSSAGVGKSRTASQSTINYLGPLSPTPK